MTLPNPLRRLVVKLGTGTLTAPDGGVDAAKIAALCGEIARLQKAGLQVVVVSSGAVGLGMDRLGYKRRPADLPTLQACAAVGQSVLTETWQAGFTPHGIHVAQILLTREDVRARKRHVSVMELFEKLLREGIVPVVNENDSVSIDEVKFGDNDLLSALVSVLVKADLLAILSTAPGLVDRAGSGEIIPVVEEITPQIAALAGGTESATAVGGMVTKIEAAQVATQSGCAVFIGSGKDPALLGALVRDEAVGTLFAPQAHTPGSKKRWLAHFEKPRGILTLDEGACRALREEGASLLAKGITAAEGDFLEGEPVALQDTDGQSIGRGISGYSGEDLRRILGQRSAEIRKLFPERRHLEVVHRDALALDH